MVQVLPQVQLCFQCVYQMAVLYMFCKYFDILEYSSKNLM
jgi:hypothetical protein